MKKHRGLFKDFWITYAQFRLERDTCTTAIIGGGQTEDNNQELFIGEEYSFKRIFTSLTADTFTWEQDSYMFHFLICMTKDSRTSVSNSSNFLPHKFRKQL